MKRLLIAVAATMLFAASVQAASYSSLEKASQAPDVALDKLPPRVPEAPPVDVLFYVGTTDNLGNVIHLVVSPNGVSRDDFDLCDNWQGRPRVANPMKPCTDHIKEDKFGLIMISNSVDNMIENVDDSTSTDLMTFSTTGTISDPHTILIDTKEYLIGHDFRIYDGPRPTLDFMSDYNGTCNYKSTDPNTVTHNCTFAMRSYSKDDNGHDTSNDHEPLNETSRWSEQFQVYLPESDLTFFDYKIGSGPWQSQTLDKTLSADDREKARALFAKGFDLFKANDFTGAATLFTEGLKTDGANVKAWAALGDVYRAAYKAADKYGDAIGTIRCYQRVIDLEPTSTEATLAKNYLKELGVDYKDLGTAPIGG